MFNSRLFFLGLVYIHSVLWMSFHNVTKICNSPVVCWRFYTRLALLHSQTQCHSKNYLNLFYANIHQLSWSIYMKYKKITCTPHQHNKYILKRVLLCRKNIFLFSMRNHRSLRLYASFKKFKHSQRTNIAKTTACVH